MCALGLGQLIKRNAIHDDERDWKEQVLDNIWRNVNLEISIRHPVEMSQGLKISSEGDWTLYMLGE